MYNNVRWLSRGLVLKRFVECFNDIKIFLNDHHISYQELSDYKWVSKRVFFADFCEHLNELNIKLQGSGKALDVKFGYIKTFEKKLEAQASSHNAQNFIDRLVNEASVGTVAPDR